MWKVFKEHWLLILSSIVLIPIAVNFIVFFHAPFPQLVTGDAKSWFSFFTTFVGTFVGALVSFTILYKTIENNQIESKNNRTANQEQNEKNRNLQIATIKYQIAKDDLNVVISCLAKYQQSFNFKMIASFTFHNTSTEEFQRDLQSILQLSEESNISYSLLNMNLVKYDDEYELEFRRTINRLKGLYDWFLRDLIWFMDESRELNPVEYVKSKLDEYEKEKKSLTSSLSVSNLRDIVEKYDYNIWENRVDIMRELILTFNFHDSYTDLENFVKYEKKKIDNMLLESVTQ